MAIGFTFRGSAIPPEEGPKPQMIATNTESGEIVFSEVEKGQEPGHFVASVIFPAEGFWDLEIRTASLGRVKAGQLSVGGTEGGEGLGLPSWLWFVVVVLLIAGVSVFVGGRVMRRRRALAMEGIGAFPSTVAPRMDAAPDLPRTGAIPALRSGLSRMLSSTSEAGLSQGSSGTDVNLQGLQDSLTQLDQRIRRIEVRQADPSRPDELDAKASQVAASLEEVKQELQTMAERVQAVTRELEAVTSNLSSSIGYRAREVFKCNSCQSQGRVASLFRCTQCGQDSWVGWWPPGKQ